MIDKVKVREFLERFISGDMKVITNNKLGLCANLREYCKVRDGIEYYHFISGSCVGWRSIKARNSYPIQYSHSCPPYKKHKLTQRISLAKHLLTKLDDYEG